ncbi:uncharacterized protein Z518_08749 [Rhinocladiella mackenziei CBS 650.93]|uniref:Amidase domain-containing protein n=1 Tax=Rhinocladiella mackenziei CBS 650.93 TaxID=1442369 RepID=A0A0D2IHM9_9EURO|nr:uncharacterized protein Z518_08749 [Rhinocladiella mackenziei CBS 650.93]KIX02806.1 hypothetical protein Z518_08749 [Rhinocladiella mackenziei CBS 650.93]
MRPTAERTAKKGMGTTAPGQISIKVSSGPNCHSMANVKLLAEILLNGCVEPQPPIARALRETAAQLKKAEHEVMEFKTPFDCWEVAQATWRLWFQTGAKETLTLVASSGEPIYSTFKWYLETFDIKELTIPELFHLNTKQAEWRYQFAAYWYNTAAKTGTDRPIDALICPCAPSARFPHGHPVWWGYFSLWNILDYPSVILPLKRMKADPDKDAKDLNYVPKDNIRQDELGNW